MSELSSTRYRHLAELLSIPTAPFREQQVRAFAEHRLAQWDIPCFRDAAGNLVIGVANKTEYRKRLQHRDREPLRLFIAHMDHPGFHGVRWRAEDQLEIKWFGGSPVKHLAGARVWLSAGDGYLAEGKLVRPELHPKGYCIARARVRLMDPGLPRSMRARDLYGGLAFRAPVWIQGQRCYTKAADDLVGVFCILETARAMYRRGGQQEAFLGLLTRGEEVGFVGAIAHFESGWLKSRRRDLRCVSLEASRTLPGAVLGKGPVVRLGDRRTVFDPDGTQLLTGLAEKLLPGRFQRRIMDGGACEAAAATAFGLPTIGLTVPLGNYHNQGFEGGQDCARPGGPAPEFVHLRDVEGLRVLCQGLMKRGLSWGDPWQRSRKGLRQNFRQYAPILVE